MQRPWQSPIDPLESSVCEDVPFPTDEEADGMVRIAWRGPKAQVSWQIGISFLANRAHLCHSSVIWTIKKEVFLDRLLFKYCRNTGLQKCELNFRVNSASLLYFAPTPQDRYQFSGMGCMLEYLADTSVAPLQRDLVEVEDPFCSDVQQLVLENAETCVGFTLPGVPLDKLDKVKDK